MENTPMVTRITKENISIIKNPALKEDALRYVLIYDDFLKAVEESGVKIAQSDNRGKHKELREKLTKLGVVFSESGYSVMLNGISPSCEHCRTGVGSSTYILTLACNRDCYFCTNKNQADYEEGIKMVYDVVKDFKRDHSIYKKMESAALTGGEPLLAVDKCVNFIKKVKKISKSTQTRIYTNGDLVTEDVLKQLQTVGLDEIRFGIKLNDEGNPDGNVMQAIEVAVKYIPRVMVEMPVVPGTLEKMKELILKLNELNIFGINILEFLYPWINPGEYKTKGYEIASRPYGVLFGYSYAGGLPVAGSADECLELLLFCAEKKVKIGVHYCSLENKLTSQIYHHNASLQLRGTEFFSEKDFFVKTVKGYGEDIDKIKARLDANGCKHYIYNSADKFIEFSPENVKYLQDLDLELGLSYQAKDYDECGRGLLRELQIDLINSKTFSIGSI